MKLLLKRIQSLQKIFSTDLIEILNKQVTLIIYYTNYYKTITIKLFNYMLI